MGFGEKLYKLRKEKGFSQETLAEKLNTSRQAISKWENGQGFPETEKLLMIGNIFEVSIDYLLKDTVENNKEGDDGFYVSREMAEGFLLQSQKTGKHIGLGFGLFVLAFAPYFIIGTDSVLGILLMIVIATLGIISFATLGFDQDKYSVLKKEVLMFDSNYFKELTNRYVHFKRKYSGLLIIGTCLLAAGFLAFALEKKLKMDILVPYYPIFVFLIAIGIFLLLRILTTISAYELLVKNNEYTNRFSFKIIQKAKKKFNDF